MKRKILSLMTALVMTLSLLPVSALAVDGESVQPVDLDTFLKNVQDAGYNYDGEGITVQWGPHSACTDNRDNHSCLFSDTVPEANGNTPQRLQAPNAQYQIFSGQTDVSISNVNFVYIPADITLCMNSGWGGTKTKEELRNAEFQMLNTGDVTFTNCTFDKVIVSPFSSTTQSTFTTCTFENVYDAYAIKDIHSANTEVTGCNFTKCGGAIYLEGSTAKNEISITGNTFNDIDTYAAEGKAGTRGLIQFSAAGDYSNADINISGNTSTGSAAVLRQLNYSISQEQISQIAEQIAESNTISGMMFTANSNDINDQLPGDVNFTGENTVYDGQDYYKTLKEALEGIHKKEGAHTLWCKPNANVGEMTHGHVCADLTVYGNGAYISAGERDFELDTYEDINSSTKGSDLTGNVILKVYNLDGAGVWGERHSSHTLNIYLENCKNMQRVYISGATGTNDITLKNCTFDGTAADDYKKANICTIYSNAPGTIVVEDCSFTGIVAPINLNTDAVAG